MKKKIHRMNKYIYWTPRILGILFVLFLMLFSLDIIQPGLSVSEIAIGLFMHNIPAFVLLLILIISWKYEIVGGVTFILAGLLYVAMVMKDAPFEWYKVSWILTIAGPAFLVGILFMMSWFQKKNFRNRSKK
jgi:hypothetical protein